MIFDTHAHYDDDRFDTDRDAVLAALPAAGVGLVLNPGCTVASSRAALALAERSDFVYAAAGIHPEDCAGCTDADLAENPPRTEQQSVFRAQLALALELGKPVIIHDRDAHADCLAIVEEFPGLRGVFHCFSGSAEMAERLLAHGWYLGFDGPITYKNARRALEVLAVTPLDRILLETDAPYMPPVPHRGERNDSRLLPFVAETAARVKGCTPSELIAAAAENGKRLFGIL